MIAWQTAPILARTAPSPQAFVVALLKRGDPFPWYALDAWWWPITEPRRRNR